MSSYFYITSGIIGIGSYVLYKNPELKTKCIKETILTLDSLHTKYKMIKDNSIKLIVMIEILCILFLGEQRTNHQSQEKK